MRFEKWILALFSLRVRDLFIIYLVVRMSTVINLNLLIAIFGINISRRICWCFFSTLNTWDVFYKKIMSLVWSVIHWSLLSWPWSFNIEIQGIFIILLDSKILNLACSLPLLRNPFSVFSVKILFFHPSLFLLLLIFYFFCSYLSCKNVCVFLLVSVEHLFSHLPIFSKVSKILSKVVRSFHENVPKLSSWPILQITLQLIVFLKMAFLSCDWT